MSAVTFSGISFPPEVVRIIKARAAARGVKPNRIIKDCVYMVLHGSETAPHSLKMREGQLLREALVHLIVAMRNEKHTWREITKRLHELGYKRPFRRGVIGPKMVKNIYERAMKTDNLDDLTTSTVLFGDGAPRGPTYANTNPDD